ncbi:hypothetical protein JCM11251_004464 [Rhodosporidiobolus azoricus]
MAKAKSSASSATRKKHAAKAAKKGGADDDDQPQQKQDKKPLQRGEKKNKKEKRDRFAPKIKSYTPPPPPPKGAPDPVDLYLIGQGKQPDPELVVVLRRLMKKDEATVGKGVEAFEGWVRGTIRMSENGEGEEWEREVREEGVVDAMAVWAHHFPRLSLHPSRRLRLQVHALHSLLTNSSPSLRCSLLAQTRTALLAPLWVERPEYVGAWAVSSWDTDRAVRREAKRSWDGVVLPLDRKPVSEGEEEQEQPEGIDLVENADPIAGYALGYALGGATPSSGVDTPGGTAPSVETEDPAFLRTSALLTLSYLLNTLPSPLPLPDGIIDALTSEDFWSLLDTAGSGQDARLTGEREQPVMVRRAAYEVLEAIVGRKEELLVREEAQDEENGEEGEEDDEHEHDADVMLSTVSSKVLANCWAEEEGWAGIIAFLRRYPQAWNLADSSLSAPAASPCIDEPTEEPAPSESFSPSPTLTHLLTHLSLGCSSHPTTLYPTILLLLSTIPASILPPSPAALSLLFEHFWAAHSSRALSLGGRLAVDAWTSALLECLVFELGKLENAEQRKDLAVEWIARRMWKAFLGVGGEKSIGSRKTAGEMEKALARLAAKEDKAAFEAVWHEVEGEALAVLSGPAAGASPSLPFLALGLQALSASKDVEVSRRAVALVRQSVRAAVLGVQQTEDATAKDALLVFVGEVKDLNPQDSEVSNLLDDLAVNQLASLLASSAPALSLLVSHLSNARTESRDRLWRSVFNPAPPSPQTLLNLLDTLEASAASSDLKSSLPSAKLDDHLLALASGHVLAPEARYSPAELNLLQRILIAPEPLVTLAFPARLLDLAGEAVKTPAQAALKRSWTAPPELDALVAPCTLLAHAVQDKGLAKQVAAKEEAVTAVFDVAYLLPEIRLDQRGVFVPSDAVHAAQQTLASVVGGEHGAAVAKKLIGTLRERIAAANLRASPVELVEAAAALVEAVPASAGLSIFDAMPMENTVQALYNNLAVAVPPLTLSILDPLVPSAEPSSSSTNEPETDDASLSSYTRVLVALLELAARDHSVLRRSSSSWVLPHLLLLAQSTSDELLATSSPSRPAACGLLGCNPPFEVVERVSSAAEGASSYLLSSLANTLETGWHVAAVVHLRNKDTASPAWEADPLLATLDALFRAARGGDEGKRVQAARGVRTVLSAILRYSDEAEGVQDAERWLALAQNMPTAPTLASAILSAIKPVLLETPRFTRYQNELAASLAGVRPSDVDIKALPLLTQLMASAPPLDAPVIFLPQQRTVFLVQAVSKWITSDEPLPDGLETAIAELFEHLAPIIQELSGSHWELMFDLIESSLDSADWDEPTTLPAVYHACRLIAQIKELAASNADLRDTAKARIETSLELVLGLFVTRPASLARDRPRGVIAETMARLVKDLPPKLLSMDKSFEQLLRLIQDPSLAVQLSSYDLLRRIVTRHVSDLVVEVELDTEEKVIIQYPSALLRLLETPLRDGDEPEKATSFLFAWMTAFAFFESASPRLRSAYIEQLRNLELVTTSLLPSLFSLLNLSDRTRPVDLAPWFIDLFHFEYFDASSPLTLPVFAAHVYYRALQAVPSIIRSYWSSLQNLALSRTLQSFTSRNFSPLLISDELSVLRDPSTSIGRQLRDNDDFTVKVAANGSEVKVTFVVDEESMELGIKVPTEFPLAGVEVRDVRKVGVTDKQWRAWLLGMQQVITGQSAAIADAVLLFKRNVQAHFEGVESCAICYSTVATQDRSLPTKNCRTCSNKFHAVCLFKWFTTSGGSSCPLCRQLM